jgi:hypothetical protein
MNELLCPHCFHEFMVEDYDSGDCPNCGEMYYYWEEEWDEDLPEDDAGWMGFVWEANIK